MQLNADLVQFQNTVKVDSLLAHAMLAISVLVEQIWLTTPHTYAQLVTIAYLDRQPLLDANQER